MNKLMLSSSLVMAVALGACNRKDEMPKGGEVPAAQNGAGSGVGQASVVAGSEVSQNSLDGTWTPVGAFCNNDNLGTTELSQLKIEGQTGSFLRISGNETTDGLADWEVRTFELTRDGNAIELNVARVDLYQEVTEQAAAQGKVSGEQINHPAIGAKMAFEMSMSADGKTLTLMPKDGETCGDNGAEVSHIYTRN